MSLGDVNSTVLMGWKVKSHAGASPGDPELYTMEDDLGGEHIKYFSVFDAMEFDAVPIAWRSPISMQLGGIRLASPRIAAMATGPLENLLQVAARSAFWSLPLTSIRAIAKHYQVEAPAGGALYETLRDLVCHVLKISEEQASDILLLRTFKKTINTDEFLEIEGAEASFDQQTKETVDRTLQKQEAADNEIKDFKNSLKIARKKKYKLSDNVALNKSNKRSPLYQYKGPCIWPSDLPSQQVAKTLMPPNCYLWRSYSAPGSWQAHLKPHPRRSYSFNTNGGAHGALRAITQHVWTLYLEDYGLDVSACPVAGLFSDSTKPLLVSKTPGASSSSAA